MSKRVLLACLAALAFVSEAGAITFSNAQFEVNALALTSGPVGLDSHSSPPSLAPVSASAASMGGTDVATAGAIGGLGLLTTSADASAGSGIASATGTAHFLANFVLTAAEPNLFLDYTPLDFTSGTGAATTSLFVTLTSNGVRVFSDLVSGPWSYFLAPGATNLLDLTLTSEASAGFPQGAGNASSVGLVSVTSAVPLPAPWLLLLVGLGPLAAVKKRAARLVGRMT